MAAEAGESTLLQRLAAFECEDPLPLQLLQRFIAYAREHCHPELTHGAKLVLKEFYLELRKHSAIYRSTCITVRPRSLRTGRKLQEVGHALYGRAVHVSVACVTAHRSMVPVLMHTPARGCFHFRCSVFGCLRPAGGYHPHMPGSEACTLGVYLNFICTDLQLHEALRMACVVGPLA